MAKIIQLAKDLLKGGHKENIYPKTIDTAVAAETIEGEESTVDRVYLKEANLENCVNDLSSIKDLLSHKEPNILSIEVTSGSTESEGDMKPESITLNGVTTDIAAVNAMINLILNNYNIKLQLYKYNSDKTAKITVVELEMTAYFDKNGSKHIVGHKFLEGKELLIIDDLVNLAKSAMLGRDNVHYKAISLVNITDVTIDNVRLTPTKNVDRQGNITNTVNITEEALAPIVNKAIVLKNDGSFVNSTDSIDSLKELANERWSSLGILPIFYTHLWWIQTSGGRNINLTLEYYTIIQGIYTFVFSRIITVNSTIYKITATITDGDTKFTITTQALSNGN